jgi:hypothetical protein
MRNVNFNIYTGLVFLFFVNSSFAQTITYAGIYDSTIHYRIIFNPPRLLVNNDTLIVDANNDGINDLEFRTAAGELSMNCFGGASYISPMHSNCQLGSNNSSFLEPYLFFNGDSMSKSDDALQYISVYPYDITIAINIPPCANYSSWVNANNYIGFRLLNASDTSYGWAEPFLVSADSMYINQIVCESLNPGTIYSSNTYELNRQSLTRVYPNPFTNQIKVSSNYIGQIDFFLFDITSRKILQQTFANSTSLNTQDLSKGIYIYELRSKDGMIQKGKVVKD